MRVKDSRQTFLGIWVRNVVEGRTFEVWGGEQLRDFTYVDDCVEALLAAAAGSAVDGLALNVGGANGPHQLQEVAELVVSVSGTGDYELKDFLQTVPRSTSAITTPTTDLFARRWAGSRA